MIASNRSTMTDITLDIENIGGIDELTVAFEDGVTDRKSVV